MGSCNKTIDQGTKTNQEMFDRLAFVIVESWSTDVTNDFGLTFQALLQNHRINVGEPSLLTRPSRHKSEFAK
jgi:hypothetical protein